ncbi:hypothetical protein Mal4_27880 [Maioricimonas rarisocia]|uniref:Cupin domain protein n=1 Tax=Maioricimonas rarisocia TaxID=2528026 RepID=A0A517Z7Q0_9PLAN|nr:cupin [Maioricimonas rarisocia]QDU38461.1 hypothetical protein Mal4_27880 [Maioricimonas rarisocia]
MAASEPKVEAQVLQGDGAFPNNPHLPLLVYRRAIDPGGPSAAGEFEEAYERNGWTGSWRNGVFAFHHFHSTAHEVLGIAAGSAKIQFGGPEGPIIEVNAGDMAILPAGTSHKRVDASDDLLVVGAYPQGQSDYDMLRGNPDETPEARERIAAVSLPEADPLFGPDGPLLEHWQKSANA